MVKSSDEITIKEIGPFKVILSDNAVHFMEKDSLLITVKKSWLKKLLEDE